MQILKDHDLWHIKKNAVWSGNSFRLLRQPKKWRNNVKPENRSGICNLQCKGHELENLKMLRNKRPSVNHRVYWCKVWVRSSVAVSLAAEACDECRCSRLCTILLLMRTCSQLQPLFWTGVHRRGWVQLWTARKSKNAIWRGWGEAIVGWLRAEKRWQVRRWGWRTTTRRSATCSTTTCLRSPSWTSLCFC